MDLSFSRRNRNRAARAGTALVAYHRLIAGVAAAQAGSRTAALEARLGRPRAAPGTPAEALVSLFDPAARIPAAVDVLGGSFHPGLVRPVPAGDE